MSVRVVFDPKDNHAVLYCSTTMVAFGPVMESLEEAEKFLKFLPLDARHYSQTELSERFHAFVMSYVCECGEVRKDESDCSGCKYDEPLADGVNAGRHMDDEGVAYMQCEAQPAPAEDERFTCEGCKVVERRKEEKRQRLEAMRKGSSKSER